MNLATIPSLMKRTSKVTDSASTNCCGRPFRKAPMKTHNIAALRNSSRSRAEKNL